jgi:hypothetical protein
MRRPRRERPLLAAVGMRAAIRGAVTVRTGRKILPLVRRPRSPRLLVTRRLAVRRTWPLVVLGTRPLTRKMQFLRAGFLTAGSALTRWLATLAMPWPGPSRLVRVL